MMTPTTQPLTASSNLVDLLNVVGVGLILVYIYAHFQKKNSLDGSDEEREWRRKSAGVLTVFAFYSVVVATWGPSETWVAVIGSRINENIQNFATGVAVVGDQAQSSDPSLSSQISGTIKTVGLAAYVLVFGALSVGIESVRKVIDFATDLVS